MGRRLDVALVAALRDAGYVVSRSSLEKSFASGGVCVEGRPLKPSLLVDAVLRLQVTLVAPPPLRAEPEPVPLSIVFEDEAVLVIDKPAGIVVHPSAGHPGGTLVNGVLHHLGVRADGLPRLPGNDATRPGVVHRLDRDTSGVMVFSKTAAAAAGLAGQFERHSIERRYVGILSADPGFTKRRVDTFHGRDPAERKRFAPVRGRKERRAVSHVEVVEQLGKGAVAHFTLETGRTHQIRMHARHLGTPIFGDALYGRAPRDEPRRGLWNELGRHALHAQILGFEHPLTGAQVRFESPLPDALEGLRRALQQLG